MARTRLGAAIGQVLKLLDAGWRLRLQHVIRLGPSWSAHRGAESRRVDPWACGSLHRRGQLELDPECPETEDFITFRRKQRERP